MLSSLAIISLRACCCILLLYYDPGNHGSHRSPTCTATWYFAHFCIFIQDLLNLNYVFSLSIKVCVTDYGWKRGAESQRLDSALRVGPQSFADDCMFPPSLPRSDGTSQVLSRSV